ncbi:hypothetical protein D9Q98_000047 [Chlorella vulgaris]|uniref:Uncharacterized protein n=1 Tax=Chlorella vulgaris TaxID=3077 RepID=A0A9D4TY31_CHLVU|nr:hypothetical protein D9Q98_000047 [Chlorella vulgaris]
MGFEITKDTLLKVSGVSAVAYCTFATVAPREFHKTFMSTGTPVSVEAWRYEGIAGLMAGGTHLLLSARAGHTELKKDALKVAGAGWLALAAHNAYNGYQANTQPREIATANAIGQAVLGGLCLYKGFEHEI